MEIVTGFHGRPHIRPAQLARLVAGLARKGRYVLDQQDGLSATMLTANSVRIGTGDLVMDGYHFTNEAPIDLAIESGVTGQNRNDLVVCRYSLEAPEASEENTHPRRRQRGDLIILKGVPSSGSASDPTCSTATITPDTETADFPLYRIPISGLSVGTPVPLFSTSPTLWDCLSQTEIELAGKSSTGHKHSAGDITSGTLPVTRGGTGATSAAAARSNLGITMGNIDNHYICARGSATTQALGANTITTLTLNTNVAAKGSNYTYSGGGIRVAQAGDYLIAGSAYLENKGNGDRVAYIYNGSTELTSSKDTMMQTGGASIGPVSIAPKIVTLTAGSVLYLKGRTTSAGVAYTANAGTYLTIMKVR